MIVATVRGSGAVVAHLLAKEGVAGSNPVFRSGATTAGVACSSSRRLRARVNVWLPLGADLVAEVKTTLTVVSFDLPEDQLKQPVQIKKRATASPRLPLSPRVVHLRSGIEESLQGGDEGVEARRSDRLGVRLLDVVHGAEGLR